MENKKRKTTENVFNKKSEDVEKKEADDEEANDVDDNKKKLDIDDIYSSVSNKLNVKKLGIPCQLQFNLTCLFKNPPLMAGPLAIIAIEFSAKIPVNKAPT